MSAPAPTGGPAFPVPDHDAGVKPKGWNMWEGMTLRDYFAAKAMAAIYCGFNSQNGAHNWTPADFADEAYKMADAMLLERVK